MTEADAGVSAVDNGSAGDTNCSLTVCEAASDCNAPGVAAVNYGCPMGTAFGAASVLGSAGLWSVVVASATTGANLYEVWLPGDAPVVGTYTSQSVGTLPSTSTGFFSQAICYQNDAGHWVMREPMPALSPPGPDQPGLGSFSLTLTSVNTGPNQTAADGYYVHGTLHMECAPDPTTNATGTVTVDAVY
jgi:hypothetical protein